MIGMLVVVGCLAIAVWLLKKQRDQRGFLIEPEPTITRGGVHVYLAGEIGQVVPNAVLELVDCQMRALARAGERAGAWSMEDFEAWARDAWVSIERGTYGSNVAPHGAIVFLPNGQWSLYRGGLTHALTAAFVGDNRWTPPHDDAILLAASELRQEEREYFDIATNWTRPA